MHESLKEIRTRILSLATDALTRANTDAAYFDPDKQHRISLAPLAAAHAGELLLKALIAKEHPLLLFKNISEKTTDDEIDLDWLVRNGRTHDFSRLPSVLLGRNRYKYSRYWKLSENCSAPKPGSAFR
jgi:hypothetical protein